MNITTKVCSKCKEEKELNEFSKRKNSKDGLYPSCKKCEREKHKFCYQKNREIIINRAKHYAEKNKEKIVEYKKQYQKKHAQEIKEYKAQWRQENKEKIVEREKEYKEKHTEEIKKYKAQWYQENKERTRERKNQCRNQYRNYKRNTDIVYKLRGDISARIGRALRQNNGGKRGLSCMKFLPYTIQQLKEHLESQFDCYMSWENQGNCNPNRYTWNIDHIVPQSVLLYDSMEHPNFQKCWALENLRPLRAIDNVRKGSKIIQEPSINGD